MGDSAQAEPLYVRALQIMKNAGREGHDLYAASINGLAELCQDGGDYTRAELLVRRGLELRKTAVGENHRGYATSLMSLGNVYMAMGDYARVEPLFLRALKIMKQAGIEDHPQFALSLEDLARLYISMDDYHRAEPLVRRALEIRKKALGENNAEYAASLNNIGILYWHSGDNARASRSSAKRWRSRRRRWERTTPILGMAYATWPYCTPSWATTFRPSLCSAALEIKKKALGEDHPEYANDLKIVAKMYLNKGEYGPARSMMARAAEIQTAFFERTGSGHQRACRFGASPRTARQFGRLSQRPPGDRARS